jgi:predicted SnoaL-like aldol condensation-catalyzing enzyme
MSSSFADEFAAAWSAPTPERLARLLHEDVVLRQPHRPTIHGKAAAIRDFTQLLAWLPTLHGRVVRSAASGEFVFIEWQLRIPVGDAVIVVPAVDRFRLESGLVRERVVYYDQAGFMLAVLAHPSLWAGYVRYRSSW